MIQVYGEAQTGCFVCWKRLETKSAHATDHSLPAYKWCSLRRRTVNSSDGLPVTALSARDLLYAAALIAETERHRPTSLAASILSATVPAPTGGGVCAYQYSRGRRRLPLSQPQ